MATKGFKFRLAMLGAGCATLALRVLHKQATHFPGVVALKICPDILARIDKPETVIGVMGTNGKTTVSNLMTDILVDQGYDVFNNKLGGNILDGIVTALIQNSTFSGKAKHKMAILEIDERSSRLILPSLKPDFIVFTSLFRDSFKRNAHSEFIFDIINNAIPDCSKLILNADDLISSRLAPDNDRMYYSVARQPWETEIRNNIVCDVVACPECGAVLDYDFVRYNHIGHASCPKCGFCSKTPEFVAETVDLENDEVTFINGEKSFKVRLPGHNITDIYNTATACAALTAAGLDNKQLTDAFSHVGLVKSRFEQVSIGSKQIIMNLAKGQNPIACSRVFDFIRKNDGDIAVIFEIDDAYDAAHTSENVAWIYDADFEYLKADNIRQIIIGGVRREDYRVRLLLAGVDPEKILTAEKETDTPELVNFDEVDKIFVLYDVYTIDLANATKAKLTALLGGEQK